MHKRSFYGNSVFSDDIYYYNSMLRFIMEDKNAACTGTAR
jgi:hypothetical protein